jgi:hypothetical protein
MLSGKTSFFHARGAGNETNFTLDLQPNEADGDGVSKKKKEKKRTCTKLEAKNEFLA